MIGRGQIRQRIAAKNGGFVRLEMQAQNHKLTRPADGKKLPIDWLQKEGNYAIAFLMGIRDSHLSKSGPCRCLFLIRESRISRRSFGTQVLLKHSLERTLPTLAERRNPQRSFQLFSRMSRQIQEGVNLGHSHSLRTVSNFYNVVARPNFSFPQYAKVESWSVMFYEQGCHPRFIHANADSVAGDARLSHFKDRITNAIAIANADLAIREFLNGEVFSELAEYEVFAPKKAFPVVVGIHLINKNGAMLPAVSGEIGLRITIDIELAHHSPSRNRSFPD